MTPLLLRATVMASALLVGSCLVSCGGSDAATDPEDVSGDLGSEIEGITGDLDSDERECIEAAPDPATAAAECVTRQDLADQVWSVIENTPLLEGAPPESVEILRQCLSEAIDGLTDKEISELAGQSAAVMASLATSVNDCGLQAVG